MCISSMCKSIINFCEKWVNNKKENIYEFEYEKGVKNISQNSYEEKFKKSQKKKDEPRDITKQKEALKHALDIRKFEIELYWKRAAYFWAFIAIVFAGYFQVMTEPDINLAHKNEMLLILSFFGLFLSIAWFFVNKGSKYWQENWEKMLIYLKMKLWGLFIKLPIDMINIVMIPYIR